MFDYFFKNTLYIQVRKNSLRLRHIEGKSEREILAQKPFTTQRLLVGQFKEAELCLRKGIKGIGHDGLFKVSPVIVIHPLEMVEGGLSEVEEKVYQELAMSAGASEVFVHTGPPLSDAQVVTISQNKR